MPLLRRTMKGCRAPIDESKELPDMPTAVNPLAELSSAAMDAAARLTRISMDSTERVIALQLEFARTSLEQATRSARDLAKAKDVQELLEARTRNAESAVE